MAWHVVHMSVGCSWHCSHVVGGCWKLHNGHRHTLFSTKSFRAELVQPKAKQIIKFTVWMGSSTLLRIICVCLLSTFNAWLLKPILKLWLEDCTAVLSLWRTKPVLFKDKLLRSFLLLCLFWSAPDWDLKKFSDFSYMNNITKPSSIPIKGLG